ncbi:hypothetical protein RRG08_050095 [Elysia crispata]|uniref:Uncharacterized protein n=1 Tax=Elysia crispata TaxID=231223 RepID=A0AAE1D5P1_9GAST|nr:hypothetical protein RRG08_050095 [Elysia crispata]
MQNEPQRSDGTHTETQFTAVLKYGKKERKNTYWFEANITWMERVIEAKRSPLISYKCDPSQSISSCMKQTRAHNYWLQLSESI